MTDINNVKVLNRGIRAFGPIQGESIGFIPAVRFGGTVTQATSKGTAVTLNRFTGAITTHNASLAAAASITFIVNNSIVRATDTVVVAVRSGSVVGRYTAAVTAVANGSFQVTLTNVGAVASEVVVINFAVINSVQN